ncbi:hypothetical protein PFISCL1PPCAC_14013, partial [Pristionchus fissidentatus]
RPCLICNLPIKECHLGIDCCRACSVFYKRICASNRPPVVCKRGDGTCRDKDTFTSCRKCRFVRFTEVLAGALPTDVLVNSLIARDDTVGNEMSLIADRRSKSALVLFSFLVEKPLSSTETPILDRIRWNYSLMCHTRKSGEIATKPINCHLKQGDFDGSNIQFHPATYSAVVPNMRLFTSTLFDFGRLTFPDFMQLSEEDRV